MRGHVALYLLPLAGQALAAPSHVRRASCSELSTTTPNWKLTNAASSDWPGGQSGRVELFARHVPTDTLAACDVEYRLSADGKVVDYDPASTHACLNFGASALNTTVRLDMETLVLAVRSTWTCEEGATAYSASGSAALERNTSPGACLVEPSQVGDSTTCPIADVEIEGKLDEA
ncbi:uncharacterized protein F4812DRAFT_442662 [Daldinia caldariorum]|uniref:uncharacterized protein n=1 Tax=Daldinia caldariorum TaxID=326644 RepID=UPI0020077874|nr:uncharacterized protein F4812DRAFT_442662 [Daldinia caldariorum]KAI1464559.1 hypothetical protein F4812DRAFT_442662 [Daldinia caldariorum]